MICKPRLDFPDAFLHALSRDNRRATIIHDDWNSIEPHARQSWDGAICGPWSLHQDAVFYDWEQSLKLNGG